MEVILLDHLPNLGFAGDIVNVKNGYARNFLLPKKKAVIANRQNVSEFEHQKKLLEVTKAKKKEEALAFKSKIEGTKITIEHAVAETGKLYGSVTVTEIQEKLKENNLDIDRKLIKIDAPIKSAGEYSIDVQLHQDVKVAITLAVIAKQTEDAPQKSESEEKVQEESVPAEDSSEEA